MKIAVHQPNFLPYLGYFDKARSVDTFVILDDVEFTKGGFTNRNKIKKPNGTMWLTVPVTGDTMVPINEVLIADHLDWQEHHTKTLEHMYGKAAHYDSVWPQFGEEYEKEWKYLWNFNMALLKLCFSLLEIEVDIVYSSELDVTAEDGSERIIDICDHLDASHYLSGIGGKDYLKHEDFEKHGLGLSFQDFNHPVYSQQFGEFIPNLSVIDYLMNEGPTPFW